VLVEVVDLGGKAGTEASVSWFSETEVAALAALAALTATK